MTSLPSRRTFLQSAAAAAAGVTIVPRHVLGGTGYQAPSDTFNIAGVGVGGMGRSNLTALASQNIVALCDVDFGYVDRKYAELPTQLERTRKQVADLKANPNAPPPEGPGRALTPAARLEAAERRAANVEALIAKAGKAKRYQDYRQMLAEQKDIDGVLVATPDHTHAAIAMAAMSLGKHVYVQKPLCWSVQEARALAKKAAETKVATQMGNQGHSLDDARTAIEYIQGGYIGDVKEVHIWTNRPHSYWPQGVPRPTPGTTKPEEPAWSSRGVAERLAATLAAGSQPIPPGMAWDLFLGPAPEVPYHPIYHPGNWRGWVDWGQGALGDMGAHLVDHPFWALELGMPTTIETVSTPFNGASYPTATMTHYEFAARGSKPAVKLTWYDGGFKPPRPAELGETPLVEEGGVLYIGSKGKLMHDTYGANPRLLPQSLHESVGTPKQTLARIATSHEMNWVEAAKGKTPASSPFEYAARLTEVMLLGIVSLRAGTKIHYDAANMRVTNSEKANDFLRREYRTGWTLSE
jgi:Oxidoreductase family, NAD-binding Rossmann fold/Oxidoreductase family, C-terminal alpha/beta domain